MSKPEPLTVEAAINQLVAALAESKGWLRGYADSIIRDAIDGRIDGEQVTLTRIARDSAEILELLKGHENAKPRQQLALHKLTQTSVELGGYGSQCALCWGTARKENVCDACRDSMEGQE